MNGRVETQPGRELRPGDMVSTSHRVPHAVACRTLTASPADRVLSDCAMSCITGAVVLADYPGIG